MAEYNPHLSSSDVGEMAYWNVREMTQEWIRGTRANHGLLVRDDGTQSNGLIEFASSEDPQSYERPEFFVFCQPRLGEVRGYSLLEQDLTDRIQLKVNQQNGNLLVRQRELTVPGGTGPDLGISRTYNSLDEEDTPLSDDGWRSDTGDGFSCYEWSNQDIEMRMPTGAVALFDWDDSPGEYVTPTGYDATLADNGNGTFTLTEHKSHVRHDFDMGNCRRTAMRDRNGRQISFAYDGSDRIETITDSQGREAEFDYDQLARLTQETLPGPRTNTYTYDPASNLTSVTDAGGTVDYTYDDINRQNTIQEPGAPSAIDYTYVDTSGDGDPDTVEGGQKITTTLPNGVTTTEIVDAGGRLKSTTGRNSASTVLQRFGYQYVLGSEQQALVSQETDKDNNTITYGYDTLDRFVSAINNAGDDFAYTYDQATNIATKTLNGGTPTTYRYSEANQLCWSFSGTSSTGCGSPPTGATTYTYDATGNQTAASGIRASAFNRRMQTASITPNGGSATMFEYAGPGQAQRTKLGSTDVVNNVLGVASYTTGGTADYFTRDETGTFMSQRRPSASAPDRRQYPLVDRLGSTRTFTDEPGTVIRRYAYEPYGATITPPGSWTGQTPFRFAGGEADSTGLYHLGERYYDPAQARWSQQDPINQAADVRDANRYVYVAGDPVNLIDPSGLECVGPADCAWQAVGEVFDDRDDAVRAAATKYETYVWHRRSAEERI